MTAEVEMTGIVKRFGDLVANIQVDFSVEKGEIRALVGENGAGKTTLMKVLFGLYRPEEGTIKIRGETVELHNPGEAIAHRIGMVHQHFMLFEDLTVTENIIYGMEPKKWGFVDRGAARKQVVDLAEQYGFKLKPDVCLGTLSVGERQRVEIVKTLFRGADVLILDEPTAVLTPQERDELFDMLRSLSQQGKTIILITHKLREVMALSHRATVLRRGRVMGNVKTSETSIEELACMMVGREVFLKVNKPPKDPGEPILCVENLTLLGDGGRHILDTISFEVHAGEIVGLAGVAGNGQTELVDVLVGFEQASDGKITLNGENVTKFSIAKRREKGMSYIPEDRYRRGLAVTASVAENLVMGFHRDEPISRRGLINANQLGSFANRLIGEFDVRISSPDEMAGNLSGGNLQKVVLAREFSHPSRFILADQPTRGVDIGATEFIHQKIIDRRVAGDAILLISADLNEIMSVSDRILVIYAGKIVASIPAEEAEEQELGLLMAGSKQEA
ncbi:MAG: ABC transporter ATP-binding protein [Anaerolineaceae bacterium]|nr:ABC transporter ATP-binding protein [Anaerolineaceae bacterium]